MKLAMLYLAFEEKEARALADAQYLILLLDPLIQQRSRINNLFSPSCFRDLK